MHITFTAKQYATKLVEVIRAEVALDPARFRGVATWTALHAKCDANDFLTLVEESFGYEWPTPDTPEWESYIEIVNDAIEMTMDDLFPL